MKVSGIELWRDGGTISFTVEESACAGEYRLEPPSRGSRRTLFSNERKLRRGGPEEGALLAELRAWFAQSVTTELLEACEHLDTLAEWRNLSPELVAAVPFYRMRIVLEWLEARAV